MDKNQQPRPSTSKSNYKVLKCFCGCTELSRDEIENIAMMSVTGLLHNDRVRKLFKNFLKIGHRKDKSNITELLECYDLCNRLLETKAYTQRNLRKLLDLCPFYAWEEKIIDATSDNLTEILSELKIECVNKIDCHNDIDRFRRELLRKISS